MRRGSGLLPNIAILQSRNVDLAELRLTPLGSSTRMTVEEYRRSGFKSGNKYNAKRMFIDEQWFDSKAEGAHYLHLKNLWSLGQLKWFVRQVPFRLQGGFKYVADFLVYWTDGRIEVDEVKGCMTDLARLKIRQTEAIYGIKVNIIKRGRKS